MGEAQASATEVLSEALQKIYKLAGSPTYESLIRQGASQVRPVKFTAPSLSDWLNGRSVPSNARTFTFFVNLLEGRAERSGKHTRRPDSWWEALRLAAQSEKRKNKNAVQVGRIASTVADDTLVAPSGFMAISDNLDPYDLEVHRSIAVPTAPWSDSKLPRYFPREHDDLLRGKVESAASGVSQIAVLVGGSSTGKTRACWEAIHLLPPGWKIWHPIDPSRPESLLAGLRAVGPKTVIWLNESQHYLLTPDSFIGERVAAGLRQMLRDPARSPILILGTLWPEYWEAIAEPPTPGAAELHAQASALIRNSLISVPDSFSALQISILKEQEDLDPRMEKALTAALDGHLTQYLAGGPALLERYENAPPMARALIHAAADCRILGHGPSLPISLLEEAASSYVSDKQWGDASDDWLQRSLAYLSVPCRGATGALVRMRPRPGSEAQAQPHYVLSDFLEQYLRRPRWRAIKPEGLWNAFLRHAQPRELEKLAGAAWSTGLMQIACQMAISVHASGSTYSDRLPRILEESGHIDKAIQLYEYAAQNGDAPSMGRLATWLHDQEKHAEALVWERKASIKGNAAALRSAVDYLLAQQDVESALHLCREAADCGHRSALEVGAHILQINGDIEQSLKWYAEAAKEGEVGSPFYAGELLSSLGESEQAENWYIQASEAGDIRAMRRLAQYHQEGGDAELAIDWYRRAAVSGHPSAWGDVIDVSLEVDATGDSAAALLLQEEASGNEDVTHWLGVLYERLGKQEDAIEYYLESREWGEGNGYAKIGRMLERSGDYDDALFYYLLAYEEVDIESLEIGCELVRRLEGTDVALAWLEANVTVDSFVALVAGSMLEEEGRIDEAIKWHENAIEGGDTDSLLWGAEILARAGRIDDSLRWFWRAANAGLSSYRQEAARIFTEVGQVRLAKNIERYGWNSDGTVSHGWDLP